MTLAPNLRPTPGYNPVGLPPGGYESDISQFPVDRARNAVNQGGVGGFNNGANWRGNPTTMPFTAQPGPVYGTAINADQPYRATGGFAVQVVTTVPALPPFVLQRGAPQSGGVAVAQAVQQRMLALLALRNRAALKNSGSGK